MIPKKPITWSAVAKSSSCLISAAATSRTADAIMPSNPTDAKIDTVDPLVEHLAVATGEPLRAHGESSRAELGGDGFDVRRQRAQRRQRPHHLLLELLLEQFRLLTGELGQQRRRLLGDVERRVDRAQRALEGEERPRQHGHGARHFEAVALHHFEHQAHRLRVEAARADAFSEHQPDVRFERATVAAFVAAREVHGRPRQDDRVVQLEPDGHLLQRLEHQRAEPPHRPEVEEPEQTCGVDEDVPRVRVGVVEAVAQHLVEERLQEARRQHIGGLGRGCDRGAVGHGDTVDLLHHQHPSGRQRLVHLRRGDAVVTLEVLEERDAARGLGAVVELALE